MQPAFSSGRVEVITSAERRRRWSSAEKEQLVGASLERVVDCPRSRDSSKPAIWLARSRPLGLSARGRSTSRTGGRPTDDVFIDSFNGKFRAECLNAHSFMSPNDARRKCEPWHRAHTQEMYPHNAPPSGRV